METKPMNTTALFAFATSIVALTSASALGQCPAWQEGPLGPLPVGVLDNPQGLDNPTVTSAVAWDHDGNAATANWLVMGGTFVSAGGTAVQNVVAWDGVQFQTLGTGLFVFDLVNQAVTSLLVYEGTLYATGQFGLRQFNGTDWVHPSPVQMLEACRAVARYSNSVVVATQAGQIRFWNPAAGEWTVIGEVTEGSTINDLLWHEGVLYACGTFTDVNGVPTSGIAKWNFMGWSAVGSGLAHSGSLMTGQDMCIDPVTGDVWVVGRFDNAGGLPASGAARWSGTSWVEAPVNPSFTSGLNECAATALPDRRLVVARLSSTVNDPIEKVWSFDGRAWHALPGNFDGLVECVGVSDPSFGVSGDEAIVIGGKFTEIDGAVVNSVVREGDAGSWEIFRQPIEARAIDAAGEWTFGGGDFTLLTPQGKLTRIVRWDGSAILPLAGPSGEGANDRVRAICARTVRGAIEVFVGGDFTQAGGVAANRVAKFTLPDGATTGTWSAMASGFNDRVLTIAEHNGEIYAGGDFTASGISPRAHIARWNGSTWVAVGSGLMSGLNGTVRALASFNGQLHATGEFTGTGIGGTFGGIARWTGSTWQQLTSNALLGSGRSLTVDGATLVVGGSLVAAGGVPGTGGIARWNGTVWSSIGGGLIGNVDALASAGGSLWAGGNFLFDGDPNATLARFTNGAWEMPGGLERPNLTVNALLATADDVQVLGRFMDIGEAPTLPLATWSILSLSEPCCDGDVDGSGAVDAADLGSLLGLWGPVPPGTTADVNGDLVVNGADLAAMLGGWGGCP
jgi:hypothetical protein